MAITKAEGWWIDGVHVEDYGTVTDRAGWDDIPGMRGENVVLVGQHGVSWRRKRYNIGRKTLTIAVHGSDTGAVDGVYPSTPKGMRAQYEENLDALLRLFAPRHRLLSVERVHANGDRRRADCEIVSELTPAALGLTDGRVSIELLVPGAFWEDVDATTHNLNYDVTSGGEQELEVYSLAGQTAPCADPVVVVTGPCSTVAVHDTETGSGFTYASALTGAETLTVNAASSAFTAMVGSTSVLADLVLADQQLLEISPASTGTRGPYLTVETTGASAGFTVSVTARRKWLR